MDALLATFEEELTAHERANPQSTRRTQERVHKLLLPCFLALEIRILSVPIVSYLIRLRAALR